MRRKSLHFEEKSLLYFSSCSQSDAKGSRFENRDASKKTISLDVVPVWKRGYTGKGITVTVLDDGLEKDHPDLKDNYVSATDYKGVNKEQ